MKDSVKERARALDKLLYFFLAEHSQVGYALRTDRATPALTVFVETAKDARAARRKLPRSVDGFEIEIVVQGTIVPEDAGVAS